MGLTFQYGWQKWTGELRIWWVFERMTEGWDCRAVVLVSLGGMVSQWHGVPTMGTSQRKMCLGGSLDGGGEVFQGEAAWRRMALAKTTVEDSMVCRRQRTMEQKGQGWQLSLFGLQQEPDPVRLLRLCYGLWTLTGCSKCLCNLEGSWQGQFMP